MTDDLPGPNDERVTPAFPIRPGYEASQAGPSPYDLVPPSRYGAPDRGKPERKNPLRWVWFAIGVLLGLLVPAALFKAAAALGDPTMWPLGLVAILVMAFIRPTRWLALGMITALVLMTIVLAGLCFSSVGR